MTMTNKEWLFTEPTEKLAMRLIIEETYGDPDEYGIPKTHFICSDGKIFSPKTYGTNTYQEALKHEIKWLNSEIKP